MEEGRNYEWEEGMGEEMDEGDGGRGGKEEVESLRRGKDDVEEGL